MSGCKHNNPRRPVRHSRNKPPTIPPTTSPTKTPTPAPAPGVAPEIGLADAEDAAPPPADEATEPVAPALATAAVAVEARAAVLEMAAETV